MIETKLDKSIPLDSDEPTQTEAVTPEPYGYEVLQNQVELFKVATKSEVALQDLDELGAYNAQRLHRPATRKAMKQKLRDDYDFQGKPKNATNHIAFKQERLERKMSADEITQGFALQDVRRHIGFIRGEAKQRGEERFETALQDYAAKKDVDLESLAFVQWKKQAEEEAGKPLSWFEWMSQEPDKTDPDAIAQKDNQLQNVLQWNAHQFEQVNNDPATKELLAKSEYDFQVGVDSALAEGAISHELAEQLKKPPHVFIGDVLDMTLMNEANGYRKEEFFVVRPEYKFGTYVHERIHMAGGLRFVDKGGLDFLNEGYTDRLAGEIYNRITKRDGPADFAEHQSYDIDQATGDALLELGQMSQKEMSVYYAHEDTKGLLAALEAKIGVNPLELYKQRYEIALSGIAEREDISYEMKKLVARQKVAHELQQLVMVTRVMGQ